MTVCCKSKIVFHVLFYVLFWVINCEASVFGLIKAISALIFWLSLKKVAFYMIAGGISTLDFLFFFWPLNLICRIWFTCSVICNFFILMVVLLSIVYPWICGIKYLFFSIFLTICNKLWLISLIESWPQNKGWSHHHGKMSWFDDYEIDGVWFWQLTHVSWATCNLILLWGWLRCQQKWPRTEMDLEKLVSYSKDMWFRLD